MEMKTQYEFFFVGGSCGSFAKGIFYYYYYHPTGKLPDINSITGDCHHEPYGKLHLHKHSIANIDPVKKLIVVDFDEDDKPIMMKMSFYKAMWPEICQTPQKIKEYCGGEISHIAPTNFELIEKTVLSNPDYLIFSNWREQLASLTPALTLKFKDIMFGNLNEIIANFFQMKPLPEIDYYIARYRDINKKYLDN
jgi:hypothetical protein